MLSVQDFAQHRNSLLENMQDNSVAVIPSAALQQRNRDVDFPLTTMPAWCSSRKKATPE